MDATFWALISFILFFGVLAYYKVPAIMAAALDKRADQIRNELEQAKKLREEAQQLLAEYQRKRKEAEAEAETILRAAEREAAVLRLSRPSGSSTRRSMPEPPTICSRPRLAI